MVVTSPFLCVQNTNFKSLAVRVVGLYDFSSPWYWTVFFFLIVMFSYFYTDVSMVARNLGENLKRQGGIITGVRPGSATQDYLIKVARRVTLPSAVFLGCMAVFPYLVGRILPYSIFPLTGIEFILIVIICRDLIFSIKSTLLLHGYDSFLSPIHNRGT